MGIVTEAVYNQRVADLVTLAGAIAKGKRPVYTQGTIDVLRNFRITAAMKGGTVGGEISTHFLKQAGAVVNLLCDPTVVDEEKETRFADALNYILLGYVAFREGQAHERP